MVQVTSRTRVDAFWSNTLGVDERQFHAAGIQVFPNPPQRSIWRGIYVLAFDDGACVFTPPDLLETVSAGIADVKIDATVEPETWRTMAGLTVESAMGPVVHHYGDDAEGLDALAAGRPLDPDAVDDARALAELRDALPAREWSSAGFGGADQRGKGEDLPPRLFGIFDGDRALAAANLTPGPDAATDIGIVVRPEARGKGYGIQIAAIAAGEAIALHGIARFRVLASSRPTMAIATSLGFEPYGRNLTAYVS
jgi:GNAT superfamily N-acetyltransferase